MSLSASRIQEAQGPEDSLHIAAWLNLSHELRTPANAILGQVELLLSGCAGPLSSEARASLGDIQRAAFALMTQIGDIISLAEEIPAATRRHSDPKA